jgi:hypothetical protein
LLFLAFFSSSEELLEDEPVRAGAATTGSSPATASVSAAFGVASVLVFDAAAAGAASAVGLPVGSQCAAGLAKTPFFFDATRWKTMDGRTDLLLLLLVGLASLDTLL